MPTITIRARSKARVPREDRLCVQFPESCATGTLLGGQTEACARAE